MGFVPFMQDLLVVVIEQKKHKHVTREIRSFVYPLTFDIIAFGVVKSLFNIIKFGMAKI